MCASLVIDTELHEVSVSVVGKLGRDGNASFRFRFIFVVVGFVLVLPAGERGVGHAWGGRITGVRVCRDSSLLPRTVVLRLACDCILVLTAVTSTRRARLTALLVSV